ncbi:phosphoheptose isomerase [Candidatus Magnetobacterium bavaricum]|uniref:Phosphoheptose isomerase n=1 Tax=Candidatus Magnetobacterium bavaricum TaxID=29290 RepID=A0A0F3GHG4_9BACT|nr:phosphoheptose isomerase [Candidatus Magnetobacterium bavaricum]
MKNITDGYYNELFKCVRAILTTDVHGTTISFNEGICRACEIIVQQTYSDHKVIFIGNGGSASIASHMAIDFWKNGKMKSISFNDGAQLTCLGNDYGYKHVFEKPIEMFAEAGDVLLAISSSGRSENILLAVEMAKIKKCKVITMSGFDDDNPLSSSGDLNYYVPSRTYGLVEIIHLSLCHCILDTIMFGDSNYCGQIERI